MLMFIRKLNAEMNEWDLTQSYPGAQYSQSYCTETKVKNV